MPSPRRSKWYVLSMQGLAVVLVACQHGADTPREAPPGSAGAVTTPETRGQTVQVIAHPDDDILFMNPDLAAGIHSGQPTVSIYLTGGESDMPNPAEYASQRQEGSRASYARTAGVPNEWTKQNIPVPGNRLVEVDQLRARPDVRIVFLNLPEDNNPAVAGGKHALTRLWNEPATAVNTNVQNAGTVRDSYLYRRSDVVEVLSQLFATFRPTSIRAQDTQPDTRYQGQWSEFHDHPDHVVSARFAREASQRYGSEHPENRAAVAEYRDYNVADEPINLSKTDQDRKKDYFAEYVQHDVGANLGGSYKDWTEHSYYRWTRGSSWAGRDAQGQVHAFAVFGPRLAHWSRAANGAWQGPEMLPTPGLLRPSLMVLRDHNGQLVLLAQSVDGKQVLMKRQLPGGAWPADWSTLGNPHEGQPNKDATQVGVPSATVDRDGHLVVLLKNADGGVSARRENAAGGWQPWIDLGGSDVQDGVSAVADRYNVLHVFASTRDEVLHWKEKGDQFEPARAPFRQIRPAGPPVAVREPGGRVRVFARTGDDGMFATVTDSNPTWWQVPGRFPNPGGTAGPVAAARESSTGPQSVVFVRNSAGGISAVRRPDTGEPWIDLGGPVLDQPTPIVESDGSITLLATGTDGRLLVNQDTPGSPRLAFRGWRLALP